MQKVQRPRSVAVCAAVALAPGTVLVPGVAAVANPLVPIDGPAGSPATGGGTSGPVSGGVVPLPGGDGSLGVRTQPVNNAEAKVERRVDALVKEKPTTVDVPDLAVLAVTWDGENPGSEYRVKENGRWLDWQQVPVEDGAGPDAGSAEAQNGRQGTEPLVVTGAEEVEVRTVDLEADAQDLQVEVYSSESTEGDEEIADLAPSDAGEVEELPETDAPTDSPATGGQDAGTPTAEAPAGTEGPAPAETTAPAPPQTPEAEEETEEPSLSGTAANASAPVSGASAAGAYAATPMGSVPVLGTVTMRSEWGADESLVSDDVDHTDRNQAVIIHHTAGSTSYTASQVPGILRGILRYHTEGRGWSDIGYNMLVDKFGNIYEGRKGSLPDKRERMTVGAHAGGFNTGTFGVAVMGTYSSSTPTSALPALERIVGWQSKRWAYDPTTRVTLTSGGSTRYDEGERVTLGRVMGHRDVSTTECPGNGLYTKLGSIRSNAKSKYGFRYSITGHFADYWITHNAMTFMGSPVTASQPLADGGWSQQFKNGSTAHSLHYIKRVGQAQRTFGGIRSHWASIGWEKSPLRYPVQGQKGGLKNGGFAQQFEGGSIHWTPATGGHATWGGFRTAWGKLGWERGRLGYPTSNEYKKNGVTRQDFQGGYMLWVNGKAQIHYT
ncbi:N-acetylmuramoyl-L-alanine amidase [Brevibacterium samyangense]|uniref:Peptidoglycan recognition protein family domain-containing protein n=1 Tax=Brevibacterium samyangense TaxID=366888 RepID=A0ABP5EK22_9MICO